MLNKIKLNVLVLGCSLATASAQASDETGLHVSMPEKFAGKIALALKIRS